RDGNTAHWIVPSEARKDPDAFSLSLSSGNAMDLLLALGLSDTYSEEPWPLAAFANLVTEALRRHLGQRSPELPTVVKHEPGKMRITHLGRPEGYIEQRLIELSALLQRSREAGATHIGWG
ncbi:MAG TPA: hypothetical protein VMU78_09330, partial [Methylocella sp.]|nr:hypothetical protein [Methylocella sp.]